MKDLSTLLSLSSYENAVYTCLIQKGVLSATEISEWSEVPQGRVYSVLKKLEQRGFINTLSGTIKKYRAVDPNISLQQVLQEKEEELKRIETLQQELKKQFDHNDQKNIPLDYIEILSSKSSQVNKFDEMINRSNTTLYSFNKGPYATGFMRNKEEIIKSSKPLLDCINRGVKIKALFELEEQHIEEFKSMVLYYAEIGEEVRVSTKLPLKMLLSDSEVAMVSLRNNDLSKFLLTSMVVEHTDLTNGLMDLFEYHWQKAWTLEEFIKRTN